MVLASALAKHWGNILSAKGINKRTLNAWLSEVSDRLPHGADHRWQLCDTHVQKAIEVSHSTAPGLDGIPYKAYKKLGKHAATFLFDVAEDLQEDGVQGIPTEAFNHAILCCLP